MRYKCFKKRYGMTILLLTVIALVCAARLKCVYERALKSRERKLK